MPSSLSICLFTASPNLAQSLKERLSSDRYSLTHLSNPSEFLAFLEEKQHSTDCLLLSDEASLSAVISHFYATATLLPAVILEPNDSSVTGNEGLNPSDNRENLLKTHFYHSGEVRLPLSQLHQLSVAIEKAIAQFLNLSSTLLNKSGLCPSPGEEHKHQSLIQQQSRLAEKLKERLGYMGVYYKRNSQQFYRNLAENEKKALLRKLKADYRNIILNYFAKDYKINQDIDQFVNQAFFADLSVSQILEIHMDLMDQFAQQLKLEGRSEEILLDYRLALIDIIAHLGEMYRRSIPREDIPFELLVRSD
ncbi:MAG: circadian clock protein KaiA [Chroococcales cyanobacterium]